MATDQPSLFALSVSLRGAATSVVTLLVIAGCEVGPRYEAPKENLPGGFVAAAQRQTPQSDVELHEWWTRFDDPVLTEVIVEADTANQTLAAALANVKAAWAGVGVAESAFWPTIALATEYERQKVNITQVASEGVEVAPFNVYAYGVGMAPWEIDIWGKIKNQVTAATQSAQATLDMYRGALVSIRAQTASTYIQARTLQERIRVVELVIANLSKTRELVALRVAAGTATQMDLDRATAQLDESASTLPQLKAAYASTVASLAVLCGTTSEPILRKLAAVKPIPVGPDMIAVGLPASLLLRRADVLARERNYHASIATVAATEALHYPSLTLSGNFYISSNTFDGLGDLSNQAYTFGPTFNWQVFAGGRINSQVAQAKARAEEALANYRNTVLAAISEVESAGSSVAQSQESLKLQERALVAGESAFLLATLQYEQGLTDLTTLLSIANTLANLEDMVVQTRGLAAQDIVALYKALGGGWEHSIPAEAAEAVLKEKPASVENDWTAPAAADATATDTSKDNG